MNIRSLGDDPDQGFRIHSTSSTRDGDSRGVPNDREVERGGSRWSCLGDSGAREVGGNHDNGPRDLLTILLHDQTRVGIRRSTYPVLEGKSGAPVQVIVSVVTAEPPLEMVAVAVNGGICAVKAGVVTAEVVTAPI